MTTYTDLYEACTEAQDLSANNPDSLYAVLEWITDAGRSDGAGSDYEVKEYTSESDALTQQNAVLVYVNGYAV